MAPATVDGSSPNTISVSGLASFDQTFELPVLVVVTVSSRWEV